MQIDLSAGIPFPVTHWVQVVPDVQVTQSVKHSRWQKDNIGSDSFSKQENYLP